MMNKKTMFTIGRRHAARALSCLNMKIIRIRHLVSSEALRRLLVQPITFEHRLPH